MISIELAKQITGLNVVEPPTIDGDKVKMIVDRGDAYKEEYGYKYTNHIYKICEIASKCKIWAYRNGYSMNVDIISPTEWSIVITSQYTHSVCFMQEYLDDTEHEATIKSCKWVLKKVVKDSHGKENTHR